MLLTMHVKHHERVNISEISAFFIPFQEQAWKKILLTRRFFNLKTFNPYKENIRIEMIGRAQLRNTAHTTTLLQDLSSSLVYGR